MYQPPTLRLSSWARLVTLSLLLGVGLLASLGLTSRTAHAQPGATIAVSTCDASHLASAINSAASGDTITFGCSGTITLVGRLLTITKNLTLDGSGQSVTLSGGDSEPLLYVYSGVNFTLNALTVAHGAGGGGGLFNDGGTVTISNSTFANNSVSIGGGGLATYGGTVSISNSTFANNSASIGGGGGLVNDNGTVTISGSIVASNSGGNCNGRTTDKGYNLSSDSSCGFTGTGDLQNTDPKLASALASNGGPTQTLALQDGSPAIDQIPAASCPASDQRGFTRPDDAEHACDIGAYESGATPPDSDLGLTNVPSDITTDATSPQGAVVTYTPPTATDESGDSSTASVSCTPTSGSTFAIGTTKVTCTATDSDDANSPVSQSFTVTVNDTDLGLSGLPANITTDATSSQGATVTYTAPTATDESGDNPGPSVSCSSASGSVFPIGTTTVACTVSDSDDTPNSVSQSFTVTVNGAATQVNDLITTVSFHLPPDFQASFDTQLQAVQTDLTNNNTTQACSDLTAFINHAQAQSGKGLTVSQANQLMAAAKQIQAVLGC